MWARISENLYRRRNALGLAACTGVLYFTSFCGYDQHYLAWPCFAPVLWALDDESLTLGEASLIGWAAGLVAHLGVYTWIIGMLRDFGYLPLPLAVLGYVLLCLGQSSLFAVWGLGTHWLASRRGLPLVWAAPVVLVVTEWLYPALFPSYFANSQYRQIPLLQACDLWGTLGLTFLLGLSGAVLYALLAWGVRRRGRFPAAAFTVGVVLLGGTLLYGYGAVADMDDTVAHSEPRVTVGLVQTNMGIYEKSDNPEEGLRRHRAQSQEVQAQGA
ncbi:MAG TPA: hypothetical protein VFH51_06320, partial [Myxococcota bacterium]|nr:hypothetical protein [Myxococcota bacterium]